MLKLQFINYCLVLFVVTGCVSMHERPLGTTVKSDFITKTLFYHGFFRGNVRGIFINEFDNIPGNDVLILGQLNSVIINPITDKCKRKLDFGLFRPYISVISNNNYVIVNRSNGKMIFSDSIISWKNKFNSGSYDLNDIIAGDLDKNNSIEYYIGTYFSLMQLNEFGKKIRQKKEGIIDMDFLVEAKKQKSYLACVTFNNDILFFDDKLNIIHSITKNNYKIFSTKFGSLKCGVTEIECCNWPESDYIIVLTKNNNIWAMDLNGNVFMSYTLPEEYIRNVHAVSVKLLPENDSYLALLLELKSYTGRSILCIFNTKKELVYQEWLESTSGICAIDVDDNGKQDLLVGNGGYDVWRYSGKNTVSNISNLIKK